MTVKYDGTLVVLGGEEMIVPPLNFRSLRLLGSHLESLSRVGADIPSPDNVESIILILHAAIERNYPEYTREKLEDNLDLANMTEVIAAVMRVSGFAQVGKTPEVERS